MPATVPASLDSKPKSRDMMMTVTKKKKLKSRK